ncbi:regulator of chromosome condensation 1/beta-lactamase-inhibitor protein II [Xylariales sp. PMI_506]|nr:regulator of chromosome condensation 1/beta-lactamase-inhibitor protein II [Xylariales sp. PMI_506]
MELLAVGFNAWNQLHLEDQTTGVTYSDDVASFRSILLAESIGRPHASISCTLVQTSKGLLTAGCPDEWMQLHNLRDQVLSGKAAIAGNGEIVVYDGIQTIRQYRSLSGYRAEAINHCFSGLPNIIQIVSYETGFAALSAEGQVWTWGDERYGACLGRDAPTNSSTMRPERVPDLEGLPTGRIKKLSAGGYVLMALTEGNDLYAWGGHPGRPAIIEGLSGDPIPVVIEERDILDCAVGELHIVVLTSEQEIFVIGDNTNSQLGIPGSNVSSWTQISLDLKSDRRVTSVVCGPRNSFLLLCNEGGAA